MPRKQRKVHAYCIMANHIHLILSTENKNELSNVIRDLKTHTSNELIHMIQKNKCESRREWLFWTFERAGSKNKRNINHQFWQQDNHPIQLDTNNLLETSLNYIHKILFMLVSFWKQKIGFGVV